MDTKAQSSIALAGGGLQFTVDSPQVGRDRLEVGAGLSWSPTDATKVALDYTGFFGGQDEHVLAASLAVSF